MNVADCQYVVVRNVAKKILGWKLQHHADDRDWDVYWTDIAVEADFLSRMEMHQKVNHFPGMTVISRKNNLAKNLLAMRAAFPAEYSFYPKTWLLPSDYGTLRAEFENREKGKAKTFIVKPEASCQGRGIFLTRNVLADIQQSAHYVVQRYLHRPLLLEGLKFDLRIYVLLAGCDPLRVYLYKEGLTRLATVPYVAPRRENLDDLCMHLTNYAINKENPDFIFNSSEVNLDKGHKRTLSSTYSWLEAQGVDVPRLQQDINLMMIRTLVTAQPQLAHNYKSCQYDNTANNMCFEVLGFDVMLDHACKPYLLEVNYTPSFSTDTPLDRVIKENLIHDALVLMNVSEKARADIQRHRAREVQARVYTGKRKKLTLEERTALVLEEQRARDRYEDAHLGGFQKIYPAEGLDLTAELAHAAAFYESKTATAKPGRGRPELLLKCAKPKLLERKPDFSRTITSNAKISQEPMPLTNSKLANNKSLRKPMKSEGRRIDSRTSFVASEDGVDRRKKKARETCSLVK